MTNIDPWNVSLKGAINYTKLITKFGTNPIDEILITRIEQVTKMKAHHWLRRGIFFSHQDLQEILNDYENNKQIYIYTGRGPSSEAMHMGHLIPFMFTKYLQNAFNAIVIIQMSDDEKFYFKKDLSIDEANRLAYENAKDIIACGFDINKTLIFSNLETVNGALYKNVVKLMDSVTGNQIKGTYGLCLNNTIGQLSWPCFQCAPSYSTSFPKIFKNENIRCLVPMAIDQAPYFRMARDFAHKEKYIKPAVIHSQFLVGLEGINSKMSSSKKGMSTIFMTDTLKKIKKNIMKHTYSGCGGDGSKEDHAKYGGNLMSDVSYQWLCLFLEDDVELEKIAKLYKSGKMMSGEIKGIMANVVCDIVTKHQIARGQITKDILKKYFDRDKEFDISRKIIEPSKFEPTNYTKCGINFDIYFGLYK
jgi:tryptophanyl-tRNA synthetase